MKFGSIQITKKTKAGDCVHCEEALELGIPYVTITIRAKAKSGKHWFANWPLHLRCLSMWLATQLVARQMRRKKAGRPKGTGLRLVPEDKRRRLALCKKRMRILQEVAVCGSKDEQLMGLYQRFDNVQEDLKAVGGPASINHRVALDMSAIEKKLMYGKALQEARS